METRWQKSLIASMLTATILGFGAIVVWTLLLAAMIPLLAPGRHLSHQLSLLSPALLSAALLWLLRVHSSVEMGYVNLLREYWFSFALLFVLSIPLASMCYLHHRRYGRVMAAAWSVYVLVMGVPGAIGYWLHRRWPPAVRCPRCELPSPCDREECLHCGASLPLPTANGTEILQPQLAASIL